MPASSCSRENVGEVRNATYELVENLVRVVNFSFTLYICRFQANNP